MASTFERNLDKYAEVIVKVGLNIQPGQRLLIGLPLLGLFGIPLELAPLIRLVVAKAYQAGAKFVDVMWDDPQLQLIRFQHAPRDSFEEFPMWRADRGNEAAKAGDAVLAVMAQNPDLLVEHDPALTNTVVQLGYKHLKPFFDLRGKNAMNFAIVTAPVDGWTDKVFPDLPPEDRKVHFWDAIFDICRVNQPDPVAAWKDHIRNLDARCGYLNHKRFAALKLTASGTDLTLGLPQEHVWRNARLRSQNGIDFITNMPTEEVFTVPHKDKTEGAVTSTKPLSFGGNLVEGFSLTFSEGRVVKGTARKGQETLDKILETDVGAKYLGEVALVPHSSPISQSGLLFYNTLIDENASCHLALGRAIRFCIEGSEAMSDDEFAMLGGNDSIVHSDFMVGSGELDVDGLTEDGSTEPLMRSGEWAFET
jgi:aminopeptidase